MNQKTVNLLLNGLAISGIIGMGIAAYGVVVQNYILTIGIIPGGLFLIIAFMAIMEPR